jgi:hypothetical protein
VEELTARPAVIDADSPPADVASSARRGDPRRTGMLALLLLSAAGLLVWCAAATVTAGLAYLDLREARIAYQETAVHLAVADLSSAQTTLDVGLEHAQDAASRLHRPQLAALRVVPGVGPNVRTVTALGDAGATVGAAAVELLDVAHEIVHDDREAQHGEVSLAYLADLAGPLRDVADALASSTADVEAVDGDTLLGPVARARDAYLDVAGPATEQAAVAADVGEILPALLGIDGPREYLLLAASLSELRSSGGLTGSWSILRADGGHLHVDEFVDIDELPSLEADVTPPADDLGGALAARGGLRLWRNHNLTAHFPNAGEVALRMWEDLGHHPLDGVIAVDTVVFDRLARRAGGLEVPGVGRLGTDEVLPFVAVEAYAAFDGQDERKRVLGAVASAAFATALDVLEDGDVPATATMLHDLADGGHLRVYTRDEEVQPVLERVGAAGALPAGDGELAGVLIDNAAANKVDAFTTRRLDHRVQLLSGGRTQAIVEVSLRNDAPREGYPRYVLGPWTPDTAAGDNLSLVRIVCGRDCEHLPASEAVRPTDPEQGLPMAELSLLVPAGEERRIQHRTRTDDAWHVDGGEVVVDVAHLVQPTLQPSPLRIRVAIPEGWTPTGLPDGAYVEQHEISWQGETSGLVDLSFRFRPSSEE